MRASCKEDCYKNWRDGEVRIKYDGEIMRKKGDVHMVDFTVTGADAGTLDAPKFSLKSLSEEHILPEISVLVAPGGYFEGCLPIFQVLHASTEHTVI